MEPDSTTSPSNAALPLGDIHPGIVPSRIVLGTALFGSEIDRETSFAVLDAYAGAGGHFIDTAHIYAAWVADGWGASEQTVGEWIEANGVRDSVILATKGGHPPMNNMAEGRCDRTSLEHDLCDSLKRLKVDCIDLYWLHRDDPARNVEAVLDTLANFMRQGHIRAYGFSNWIPARIDAAIACTRDRGLSPIAASQIGWALADHPTRYDEVSPMVYMDQAFFQWHHAAQMPLAAYSSQATGYFGEANAAWAKGGFDGPVPHGKGFDSPASRRRLLAAIDLARKNGCTPTQIALAYLLHQPFPVFPIVSSSRPERIREALEAAKLALTDAEVVSLCK